MRGQVGGERESGLGNGLGGVCSSYCMEEVTAGGLAGQEEVFT